MMRIDGIWTGFGVQRGVVGLRFPAATQQPEE